MYNVDERHQGHENLSQSLPQTQVNHKSRSHTRGPSHCSSGQVGGRAQRLHDTPPQRKYLRKIGANWDHPQERLYAEGSATPTQEPPNSTTKPEPQSTSRTTTKIWIWITCTVQGV